MQHISRTFVVLSTVAACIIGGVADARAQFLETVSARALQQCATPYADHGVSETTIVYGIDRVVPDDDLFLPMDVERNTLAYRQQAFTFFAERFGVAFDVARTDDQEITDAAGRSAVMRPIRLTRGASHQVYAIDDQDIARWRHRLPMTNVALVDDGYFVFVGEEGFEVFGSYGGADGIELPPGAVFLLGDYRMFDHRGRLIDTLRYFSEIPALRVIEPKTGEVQFTISCAVESEIFGAGLVRALGTMTTLDGGGTDMDFRYTMRFSARIGDADVRRPQCKPIRAPVHTL